MEIGEFQKKLAGVLSLAKKSGKKIRKETVDRFFETDSLEKPQMEKIYAYLKQQGISVEGAQQEEREKEEPEQISAEPLTEEEEAYLREYEKSLEGAANLTKEQEEALFARYNGGDPEAAKAIAEMYQNEVVRIAKECHPQGVFLGDLIQDGNLALLAALQEQPQPLTPQWLKGKILEGIHKTVKEQARQKYQDECLVEKVRKLEEDVRALTEDTSEKYSVKELSIILDMSEEEILDVLRLTGDDK